MKNLADLFSAVFEIIVINYFFNLSIKKRWLSKYVYMFMNILFVVAFMAIEMFVKISFLAPLLFLAIIIMYGILIYKANILKTILLSLLVYIFGSLSEIIVGIILVATLKLKIDYLQQNAYLYFIAITLSRLLHYWIVRATGLIWLNKKIDINMQSIVLLIIVPVSSIANIYYLSFATNITSSYTVPNSLPAVIFLTAISNVLIFYFIDMQSKLQQAERELLNMQTQYKMQSDYYLELKENMIISNQKSHDINNFMIGIQSFLSNNKIELTNQKLNEFLSNLSTTKITNTGNNAVNALIHSKYKAINEIKNNNVSIILPSNLKIDEIDLCIIIGNAIDNCIEACSKIEDEHNQYINIKIFPFNNQISMLFENSYNNDKQVDFLQTTKIQKYLHGFGTKNMKLLCEKYNGSIVFEQFENKFSVSILLPN